METIITFILSFAFGWVARELYARYLVTKLMIKIKTDVEKEVDDRFMKIIIEKQNEIFYVYDAKDKTFMAQGDSRNDVEKKLAIRFPGKMFAATPDNLKEVGFDE